MKLTSYGAAESVTGSKHLLEIGQHNLLLDCGMFQGRRSEANERNRNFPKEVLAADAVILSHAHIDHSGALPSLVKAGFTKPIYSTPATRDLCEIMLADAAHIAESDAEHLNKNVWPPVQPIYDQTDVAETLKLFQPVKYGDWFTPVPGVRARFHDAGHILGSAQVELEITEDGKTTRLGFTGDLGRKNLPILRDPEQMQDLDILLTESTYGNREHESIAFAAEDLLAVIERTVHRGGKLIIPAFSVERTQEIVYVIHELRASGKLGYDLPIFVDSPLAVNATDVFVKHRECYDAESYATFIEKGEGPFTMNGLEYVRDVNRSKELNRYEFPAIIISASGMCEAGRILHHLKNNIEDPRNTILIVGFQAANTLGRRLVEQLPVVNIFNEPHKRKAEVVVMNSFSGHADKDELFQNVKNCGAKKVFCVHGETSAIQAFAERIHAELGLEVHAPREREELTID
jgi:metallo-beta-lactamase family protein